MDKRKDEMLLLRYKKFWTLEMIARKFGLTRQRVCQIIGRTGTVGKMIEKQPAR